MNGHLFGAGDPGAALVRKQRQKDARVRIARRATQNTAQASEADREQDAGPVKRR